MKTNIDNLDKHLKTLRANINDNHLGGVFDILSDAMVELNMIKMKANGADSEKSNFNIPHVSTRFVIALETTDGIIKGRKYPLIEIDDSGLYYFIIDESGEEASYWHSVLNEC